MTTIIHTAARVGKIPGRFAARLGTALAHRAALRALHKLDDHILRDIGISRGEIEASWRATPRPPLR